MRRVLLAFLLMGCQGAAPEAPAPPPGVWTEAERRTLAQLRLDTTLRPSPSNRWADDPDAAALGQALFFDAGLSPSGRVSCSTRHDPARHFTDGKARSEGVGTTERGAPPIPGSQWGAWFFWDGHADSLWSQAAGPVEAEAEMGSDRTFMAHRIVEAHREAYEAAFGAPPELPAVRRARPVPGERDHPQARAWEGLSPSEREAVMQVYTRGLKAIAAYERKLVPTEAPFDRYVDAVLAGDPDGGGHLAPPAVEGLSLFVRDANCVACHNGPLFTDRAFHNLGLPPQGPFDGGRSVGARKVLEHELNCRSRWSDAETCPELDHLDPSFPDFQQAFKTPTLRNVAATAPYMHRGHFPDLRAVVDFYSELPGDPGTNHRELTLRPLDLTAVEKDALVAFLTSLSGPPLPASLTSPPPSDPGPGTRPAPPTR